jgi:tryptophan synthase alpha chain
VAVGFGVRTPEQAAAIGAIADGVVVGSAIVELIGKHGANAAEPVKNYIATLRQALNSTRQEKAA